MLIPYREKGRVTLMDTYQMLDIAQTMDTQARCHVRLPPVLVEQRILELEALGLADEATSPEFPSTARQYAMASFQRATLSCFITMDEAFIMMRDLLEFRYGLKILSVPEAIMLLSDSHGPVD